MRGHPRLRSRIAIRGGSAGAHGEVGDALLEELGATYLEAEPLVPAAQPRLGIDVERRLATGQPLAHQGLAEPPSPGRRGDDDAAEHGAPALAAEEAGAGDHLGAVLDPELDGPIGEVEPVGVEVDALLLDDEGRGAQPEDGVEDARVELAERGGADGRGRRLGAWPAQRWLDGARSRPSRSSMVGGWAVVAIFILVIVPAARARRGPADIVGPP